MSDVVTGAKRYQRRSPQRDRVISAERFKAVEFGNPLPTFKASITYPFTDEELATVRRSYTSIAMGGTPDTVFWDHWDDDYNRDVFEPFFQPAGIDAGRIGAVELKVPGNYLVRAQIDWNDINFNLSGAFRTWLGGNYDEAGLQDVYMDLATDILGSWSLNQIRHLWPAYTSSENWVEIIAGHDHPTTQDLYIPGSATGGYWAHPPHLVIVYLGGADGHENYFSDTT